MHYCDRCGKDSAVVDSDIGRLCLECAADHMGIPVTDAQKKISCGGCRAIIKDYPLLFTGTYFHKDCLIKEFLKLDKCPKCGVSGLYKSGRCSCGWDVQRVVDQAEKDAMSALVRGQLCSQCLKFNASTSMGLPLMASDPWPADTVCSRCDVPLCEKHTAFPPKENILDLGPKKPICSGGFISSCYETLQERLKCSSRDCFYNNSRNWECNACKSFYRDHFPSGRSPEETGHCSCYDPLVSAQQCDNCESYFCGEDHEHCPDCVGISCDNCGEQTPQEELYPHGGYYNPDMICADCHSSMVCHYCGEDLSKDEQEKYRGYCEFCAVKEGEYVKCDNCSDVIGADTGHRVTQIDHMTWGPPDIAEDNDDIVFLCPDCFADEDI